MIVVLSTITKKIEKHIFCKDLVNHCIKEKVLFSDFSANVFDTDFVPGTAGIDRPIHYYLLQSLCS